MSSIEYTAQAASSLLNGEVKMTIAETTLNVSTLFDSAEIAFTEINAVELSDYAVTVKTGEGDYTLSRLGSWFQPFYDELCAAYNTAVLRSFFIEGAPLLTARGDYRYIENDTKSRGAAPFRVYENNIALLPPELAARRIPLCFARNMQKDDFELTVELDTDESYTFARLGYDTEPFAAAVEKQIRQLREKTLTAVREIDPSLNATQANQIAKIMPLGAAAPLGQLAAIAPSFPAALESRLAETRAAEYYEIFKELSEPDKIYIGFRKNEKPAETPGETPGGLDGVTGALPGGLPGGGNPPDIKSGSAGAGADAGAGSKDDAEDETSDQSDASPYLLWLIVPSPSENYAAVEFAEPDSATFIYKADDGFEEFARRLNRALEATAFKREAIRLAEEELLKPENAHYYMASKRTAALKFIRSNFTTRIIHTSPEKWRQNLKEAWEIN